MKQKQPGLTRAEALFLAASGMAATLAVGLALWFSPPLYAASSRQIVSQNLEQLSKVDLNTADLDALCTLPGVGEQLARDILTFRERRGSFERVEELIRVDGVTRQMIRQWTELDMVWLS